MAEFDHGTKHIAEAAGRQLFVVALARVTADEFRAALCCPTHPAPSSAPAPLAAGS